MSNTASTVPGKKESFLVRGPEPDSRLIRRPRRILRRLHENEPKPEAEKSNSNPEYFVEREDFHREFGRGRGFSYVFTGKDEEKEWTKSKPLKEQQAEVDEEAELEKLKKERKFAPQALTRSWEPPSRPLKDRIKDPLNKKKTREDYRKFMNLGPKRPKNKSAEGPVGSGTQKALMAKSSGDIDKIAEERRTLLELDRVSRKRIKQLEDEVKVLEESFSTLNRENEQLRKKLNAGDQFVVEPYQRVYEDRKILRDSEASYKAIIASLESQLKELQKAHAKVQKELAELKSKYPTVKQQLESQAKVSQTYWDGKAFKDENNRLRKINEQLRHENEELKKIQEKSNPYIDNQRQHRTAPTKLPDINTPRSARETYVTPRKSDKSWKSEKTSRSEVEASKRRFVDPSYELREDFVNMLPDYYHEQRSYKLRGS